MQKFICNKSIEKGSEQGEDIKKNTLKWEEDGDDDDEEEGLQW